VSGEAEAARRAFQARCAEAAASPWRLRLAELLVERVAATDLRRLSQRRFEWLLAKFGWLVLDECPPFETVCRPEDEIRFLWDGRRRSGKELRRLGLGDAYDRVRAEGFRRQRVREGRWFRRRPHLDAEYLRQRGLPARVVRIQSRAREHRSPPRRVGSNPRRSRAPARSTDDDPDPARRALARLQVVLGRAAA
jgi:hypothetical protein